MRELSCCNPEHRGSCSFELYVHIHQVRRRHALNGTSSGIMVFSFLLVSSHPTLVPLLGPFCLHDELILLLFCLLISSAEQIPFSFIILFPMLHQLFFALGFLHFNSVIVGTRLCAGRVGIRDSICDWCSNIFFPPQRLYRRWGPPSLLANDALGALSLV